MELVVISDLHLSTGYNEKTGKYSRNEDFFFDEEFKRFQNACNWLYSKRVDIVSGLTKWPDIKNKIIKLNGDISYVDFFQKIKWPKVGSNRVEMLEYIAADSKATCIETMRPIVMLAQLKRDTEGSEPRPSHIKGSGGAEESADTVIMPYTVDKKLGGNQFLSRVKNIIGKDREGLESYYMCDWDRSINKWYTDKASMSQNDGSANRNNQGVNN